MSQTFEITLENNFKPSTVEFVIDRVDDRIHSSYVGDRHMNVLRFMARNSDPVYGPRNTTSEIRDDIKPIRKTSSKYPIETVRGYCWELESKGLLQLVGRNYNTNLWVYQMPLEGLAEEPREIFPLIHEKDMTKEEIAAQTGVDGQELERALDILRYQKYIRILGRDTFGSIPRWERKHFEMVDRSLREAGFDRIPDWES